MTNQVGLGNDSVSLLDTLPSVAVLIGGVPVLTVLVMTAARYVASGTF